MTFFFFSSSRFFNQINELPVVKINSRLKSDVNLDAEYTLGQLLRSMDIVRLTVNSYPFLGFFFCFKTQLFFFFGLSWPFHILPPYKCYMWSAGSNTHIPADLHRKEAQTHRASGINWWFSLPVIVSVILFNHLRLCYTTHTCPHTPVWISQWGVLGQMLKVKFVTLGGMECSVFCCFVHLSFN